MARTQCVSKIVQTRLAPHQEGLIYEVAQLKNISVSCFLASSAYEAAQEYKKKEAARTALLSLAEKQMKEISHANAHA